VTRTRVLRVIVGSFDELCVRSSRLISSSWNWKRKRMGKEEGKWKGQTVSARFLLKSLNKKNPDYMPECACEIISKLLDIDNLVD